IAVACVERQIAPVADGIPALKISNDYEQPDGAAGGAAHAVDERADRGVELGGREPAAHLQPVHVVVLVGELCGHGLLSSVRRRSAASGWMPDRRRRPSSFYQAA